MKHIYFISVIFLIFSFSCRPPAVRIPKEAALADIYNPGKITLHPDYSVYHINDSSSVAYIRLSTSELLFSMANEENEPRARVRIKYQLIHLVEDVKKEVLRDSSSMVLIINKEEAKNSYFTSIPLRAYLGNKYFLLIDAYDELRRTKNESSLVIDRTTRFTSQNYKIVSPSTGYPLFNRTFSPNEQFRIIFNQLGYDSLYVDFYNPDHTMPRPLFSNLPEIPAKTVPDTSWVYSFNDSILFELAFPGTFFFRVNKSQSEGLTLMNFGEYFPNVRTPDDLLGPLIYLTSSTEFRDLRMQLNRKLAVDNFWLGIAGNMEAARELIKVYYNRVLFANLYFTSFKEGWKTDRGMVYIVFGAPNNLEVSPNVEKWTYYTGKGSSPIEFVFERKENIFTTQDYTCIRDVNSNPYWKNAVQSWKKGKIYSSIN